MLHIRSTAGDQLVASLDADAASTCGLSSSEESLRRNVKRFRGGLVCKAHFLLSLNSRLESNKEEEEDCLHANVDFSMLTFGSLVSRL